MKRTYIFDGMSSALRAIVRPSVNAPKPKQAPYQNHPKQAVGTVPFPRQGGDHSQTALSADMNALEVVAVTPHFQPAYIPRAPHTPVGAKTVGVVDQRLMQVYPAQGARDSYVYGPLSAPARLQSVPGYVSKQVTITKSSPGYPTQAMKAPRPRTGGGGCKDE